MRMTNDRCSNNYKWMKAFELKFQYVNIEIEQTHNGWRHNVIMVVKTSFHSFLYGTQEVVNYAI